MSKDFEITMDREHSLGYVRFSQGEVASTIALTSLMNLDLDSTGSVLGLELLKLDAEFPKDVLVNKYHLDASVVDELSKGFIA